LERLLPSPGWKENRCRAVSASGGRLLHSAVSQSLLAAVNQVLLSKVGQPLLSAVSQPLQSAVSQPLQSAVSQPHLSAICRPLDSRFAFAKFVSSAFATFSLKVLRLRAPISCNILTIPPWSTCKGSTCRSRCNARRSQRTLTLFMTYIFAPPVCGEDHGRRSVGHGTPVLGTGATAGS